MNEFTFTDRSLFPGIPTTIMSHCNMASICGNNTCFFRRRDIHSMPVWATEFEDDYKKDNFDYLNRMYGPWKFPNLEAVGGTNCMYIHCASFKEKETPK